MGSNYKHGRYGHGDTPLMDKGRTLPAGEVVLGMNFGGAEIQLTRNNAKPGRPLPPSAYDDPRPGRSALDQRVKEVVPCDT